MIGRFTLRLCRTAAGLLCSTAYSSTPHLRRLNMHLLHLLATMSRLHAMRALQFSYGRHRFCQSRLGAMTTKGVR